MKMTSVAAQRQPQHKLLTLLFCQLCLNAAGATKELPTERSKKKRSMLRAFRQKRNKKEGNEKQPSELQNREEACAAVRLHFPSELRTRREQAYSYTPYAFVYSLLPSVALGVVFDANGLAQISDIGRQALGNFATSTLYRAVGKQRSEILLGSCKLPYYSIQSGLISPSAQVQASRRKYTKLLKLQRQMATHA